MKTEHAILAVLGLVIGYKIYKNSQETNGLAPYTATTSTLPSGQHFEQLIGGILKHFIINPTSYQNEQYISNLNENMYEYMKTINWMGRL